MKTSWHQSSKRSGYWPGLCNLGWNSAPSTHVYNKVDPVTMDAVEKNNLFYLYKQLMHSVFVNPFAASTWAETVLERGCHIL